jgi:molybdopterin converting factor small subunit
MPRVTVEFFGVPRQRAGRPELVVDAATLRDLLAEVERACPGLTGLVGADGRLSPHHRLSIEGRRFVTSLAEPIESGARILLLSADVGG